MAGNTPVYGFPYPEPTDLVADYPALGQQLAEDIEDVLPTIGGLAPATPTSIANSGGSASLTGNTVTFSGVSSVSLNGCFTGDYDNYRVLVNFTGASTSLTYLMRMRAAGSDNTTSNYHRQVMSGSSTTVSAFKETSASTWAIGEIQTTAYHGMGLDVRNPQATQPTVVLAAMGELANSDYAIRSGVYIHGTTTQFDGFTLYPSTGNFSGKVSVYGFKK